MIQKLKNLVALFDGGPHFGTLKFCQIVFLLYNGLRWKFYVSSISG